MMQNAYTSVPYMMELHMLFVAATLFGAVLLLVWLIREGKRERIVTVIWVTLVVGILGALLTSRFGIYGMGGAMMNWLGKS